MALSYDKQLWKDHITQYPNRYTIITNPDGTIELKNANGNIIQQGTPVDAEHLNHIEDGLSNLYANLSSISGDLTEQNLNIIDLAAEVEVLKAAMITGVDANMVVETFRNIDDIKLYNGGYNSTEQKLYV